MDQEGDSREESLIVDQKLVEMEIDITRLKWLLYLSCTTVGFSSMYFLPNFYYIKDVLKKQPYEEGLFSTITYLPWSIKPIIGYTEDSIYPYGYRLKGWLLFGAVLVIISCTYIVFLLQGFLDLLVCVTLITVGIVFQDCSNQGLTVIIRKKIELKGEIIKKQAEQRGDDLGDNDLSEIEGKAIYGRYIVFRTFLINLIGLLSGYLTGLGLFKTVYAIIMVVQLVFILYVVLILKEVRSKPTYDGPRPSFLGNLKAFWEPFQNPNLFYPLVFMWIAAMFPNLGTGSTYILIDKFGWNANKQSIIGVISTALYIIFMIIVNNFESLSTSRRRFIAGIAMAVSNFTDLIYLFTDITPDYMMVIYVLVGGLIGQITLDQQRIPLVVDYLKSCPKGLETFSVVSIIASQNLFLSVGGLFGSFIIKSFDVTSEKYYNIEYPLYITFGYGLMVLILVPFITKLRPYKVEKTIV